jgi:hypothetical protein
MILAVHLGSLAAAEPSVEQLAEIRELLAQNDVAALRTYLERYPELLQGDAQLAVLLRRFLLESKHLPNYLLSDSDTRGGETQAAEPRGAGRPGRDAADGGGADPDGPDNGIY